MKFKVPRTLNKGLSLARRRSPELCLAGGIVAGFGATIWACKVTLDAVDKVVDHKLEMNMIRDIEDAEKRKSQTLKEYKHITCELAKLYAGPLMLGAFGVTLLISGNHISSKRNAALTASLATVNQAFNDYRQRVIDKEGTDADMSYLTGIDTATIEEIYVDKNGKEKKRKKKINYSDPKSKGSGFGFYITPKNRHIWSDDDDLMALTFQQEQNYLNQILKIDQKVTANQMYERFDHSPNKEDPKPLYMGWVYGSGAEITIQATKTSLPNGDGTFTPAWFINPNVNTNIIKTLNQRKQEYIQEQEAAA